PSVSIMEGSSFTLSLTSASDPSPADVSAGFTYAFDCGAGTGFGPFSSSSSATCLTTDNRTRTVKGQIRDKDGGATAYTGTVTVTNVPPVMGPLNVPSGSPPALTVITVSATFTDAGVADTHTASIDWG